jgi:hypothetical protein
MVDLRVKGDAARSLVVRWDWSFVRNAAETSAKITNLIILMLSSGTFDKVPVPSDNQTLTTKLDDQT